MSGIDLVYVHFEPKSGGVLLLLRVCPLLLIPLTQTAEDMP